MKSHTIARFWSPLAATWIMMALEGPILAATIARLPDPKINLAAHGVAFAIAILIEAPVMMIMSAATALVRNRDSYRRLRLFAHGLNAFATALLCILLVPTVFRATALDLLNLPRPVADLTYGALWIFLPWPTAIGYRRFLHGVMIRAGKTRQVAAGTLLRLGAMGGTALVLGRFFDIPGAWVGAASLTAGVSAEAIAARCMAAETIRRTLATEGTGPSGASSLTYSGILAFYYPLALTSLIGLAAHPMLTFFMGRGRAPLESLAVFPVVHALSFLFRAPGLSYQEAVIALVGKDPDNSPAVSRFGTGLGLASSLGMALFAFTPLFGVWFETVSGLTPELAGYARVPAMILVPLPALAVRLSYQRAMLVLGRRTKPITGATSLEVAGIAVIFAVVGWGLDLVGITAAVLAFLGGRMLSILYLHHASRGVSPREGPADAE